MLDFKSLLNYYHLLHYLNKFFKNKFIINLILKLFIKNSKT